MTENTSKDELTRENILEAYNIVRQSPLCRRTPVICHAQDILAIGQSVDLYLKLESTQVTGSFKVRGLSNQLHHIPDTVRNGTTKLITMSAGNYGKAFSYAANKLGLDVMVLMPVTAPKNRVDVIKGYGAHVETMAAEELEPTVNRYVENNGMRYLHSFDDLHVVAGHASAGIELLEEISNPDIVLVCCGGGGLVSGIAAAIKLSGLTSCRVYAVEPEGANTMYESFKVGSPVSKAVKTIAGGLAPPFAGSLTYKLCRRFVDDVLLVSDEEIITAVRSLYNAGFVVEPSGAAAFAALQSGKVPDVANKKVAVFITGGNVQPDELCHLLS